MRISFILLVLIVLIGCSNTPETADVASELENVAGCFEASTVLLQREPIDPKNFAQFLHEGTAANSTSEIKDNTVDFSALNWTNDGAGLQTSNGSAIRCRIEKQEHDNYGDLGTAFLTTYTFFVPNTELFATTTIELSMKHE